MADAPHTGPIAICGMACVFPGAADLTAFWRNLRDGFDAITEVPPSRWDPIFYDPSAPSADRFYCKRGGFIDEHASFDPLAYSIMPIAAQGAEPDQLLALRVAEEALRDAVGSRGSRGRTGVILGRGGYLTSGMARLDQRVRMAEQLVTSLRALVPGIGEESLAAVKADFRAQLGDSGPETTIGLVPNLAASRIANRLDLHGPAYTVDAACASALVAVDHACRELESGRCDEVLCGGVHLCHDVTFWSVFSQLGALSHEQEIRPLDRRADGLLIGEGVGIVLLKRLSDAERDGDRVYAVIRGVAVGSDGRGAGLMKPEVDGQVAVLERAWRAAAIDPATVGLIEAHGTATPAGDAAEIETLARVFGVSGGAQRAGVGSVKSMIGHTMPAAGAAGLIKAALAIHHGVLPPTLHCTEPHPMLDKTRFRPVAQAEPWQRGETPRRAGVNAFGFGGINGHVVLEQAPAAVGEQRRAVRAKTVSEADADEAPPLILSARTPAELMGALRGDEVPEPGPCRLALFDPTQERRARALAIVERGKPWHGRKDIWFSPAGLVDGGGKIAFLFPGLEAATAPRVEDVAEHFGLALPEKIGETDLERRGESLVGANRILDEALRRLGVCPDALAGHSIGEWSGMIAAEMIPRAALDDFVGSLEPGSLEVPDVVFAALGCGAERAEEALRGLEEIAVSHDNCPHQSIICGREASIEAAVARLREERVICRTLPFRSGFHSPLFGDYLAPHREHFALLPLETASIPLWSATSLEPYSDDPGEIRALAVRHLVEPVRFRELVERLYQDGMRVFVQVGQGSLVGFVDDTLRGRPHLAISASVARRSGLDQLRRVAAALRVEGVPVRMGELFAAAAETPERQRPSGRRMRLALGAPLVRHGEPLPLGVGESAAAASRRASGVNASENPVLAELDAALREMAAAQEEVVAAWKAAPVHRTRGARLRRGPRERTWRKAMSVGRYPELVDHTFYRQPKDWHHLEDEYPVVPMTMHLELMIEHALELVPDRLAVAVEKVRAYRWLAVAPEVEIEITAHYDGKDRVRVKVGEFAEGTVVLGTEYEEAPEPEVAPLVGQTPAPVTAERLYEDRWMFHGPAYRGVSEVGAVGSNGIRGTLAARPARGALLDNAGQLMGYWIMLALEVDRLAFPVRIQRIDFFGPAPKPGQRVPCDVRITEMGRTEVRADMELRVDGRVWAKIYDWADRRFDTDAALFTVLRYPEDNLLAEVRERGYCLVAEHWRSSASRELFARRYLDRRERQAFESMGPRERRGWLLGRIAVKDAVRDWLWKRGSGPLFPIEVAVRNQDSGRPVVSGPFTEDLRVSLAHKDDVAVARVAVGHEVGIDIERVEPRGDGFAAIAFSEAERSLRSEAERDEWLTRVWAAKEAYAKSIGTGLEGNPRRFEVREVAGERLLVGQRQKPGESPAPEAPRWVDTCRDGDHVVAWTL